MALALPTQLERLESLELWKEYVASLLRLARKLWTIDDVRVYLYDARGEAMASEPLQLMEIIR